MVTFLCAPRTSRVLTVLSGLVMTSTPASMALAAQARLVRCGAETCLRVTGNRSSSAVAVRIAGQDLAVEGNRAWRVTVLLPTARDWPGALDGTLRLTLVDIATRIETAETAAVPPGALGRHVELATLIVHAH